MIAFKDKTTPIDNWDGYTPLSDAQYGDVVMDLLRVPEIGGIPTIDPSGKDQNQPIPTGVAMFALVNAIGGVLNLLDSGAIETPNYHIRLVR